MKPNRTLAETTTPDGARLILQEHDGSFAIRCGGRELMHSRASASEVQLGELATERIEKTASAKVLVGGLGLGFTLRSVLAQLGPGASVEVAELIPAVVDWNRTHLLGLNGECLNDPRVQVVVDDVAKVLQRAERASYDAVMLDVDNGPVAMVQAGNAQLYAEGGLRMILMRLKPGGRAVFWSAGPDVAFVARLKKTGFVVEVVAAKVYATAKRASYVLFVAERPAA